uniref:Uncharacterized protein n=1 Tax=Lepeophtheirus salmonis TaxID=72036 RepID=A0A0K2UUY8_LEPSM
MLDLVASNGKNINHVVVPFRVQANVYIKILDTKVLRQIQYIVGDSPSVFQQDGAPATQQGKLKSGSRATCISGQMTSGYHRAQTSHP